ncbi:uncharacterized protein LOC133844826 [Drosophila sulfurigaster albostrigata]|uniref:uncharacterized protein LOC133844826 n=1 Tax=Drosophila sulfurigaster albostrigata TaxID=89887 RepID=UPI002D2185CF|nr:uncharacterized protein LOC133844826 [Drosophila sulfurigaster albostrigata]
MMFVLKVVIIWLTFAYLCRAQLLNSLNNYGDNTYPDRCVLDMGNTLLMLKLGEMVKLDNLPCTSVFCAGDGWGMLQTCSHDAPPDDCRYSNFDWDAEYPKCCNRRVICD